MNLITVAVLRTLAYGDVFDYPLTGRQAWRFLITPQKVSLKQVSQELKQLVGEKKVGKKGSYYFLPGREKIVSQRQKREKWSQKKLKKASRVGRWLKLIPSVRLVGVSGALAMANSDQHDDIDLLLVTSRDRLWLTRLLVVGLLELVTQRRRPGELGETVRNKICLNMFLDQDHLSTSEKKQDLYQAHEVAQLLPLWDRQNTYQQLVFQNIWVKKYLANWKS